MCKYMYLGYKTRINSWNMCKSNLNAGDDMTSLEDE